MGRSLTTLVAAAVLLVGSATTAYAATGSPPVTTPDQVKIRAGDFANPDVTANDLDPDGDQLEVCRVGGVPGDLKAGVADGQLLLAARQSARGTYTLTYYACDSSYLTPGTVTVTVGPPRQSFDIRPIRFDPYVLRLTNTYKHQTFHCQWGPIDSDRVVGTVSVKPLSTVTITVRLHEFDIDCTGPRGGYGAGFGSGDDPGEGRVTYSANASGGGQAQTRLRSP
jgi:hypothetical protein